VRDWCYTRRGDLRLGEELIATGDETFRLLAREPTDQPALILRIELDKLRPTSNGCGLAGAWELPGYREQKR
jgi:hypothetical protein